MSDPGDKARVRVIFLEMCSGKIELHLEIGSGSDLRATVRLCFKVSLMHV